MGWRGYVWKVTKSSRSNPQKDRARFQNSRGFCRGTHNHFHMQFQQVYISLFMQTMPILSKP